MPGRRRTRTLILTALSLAAWSGLALAEGPVRVTIRENLPNPWNWQTATAEPNDAFEAPIPGFPQTPARVNAHGIEADRSIPFALHAETELRVVKGHHRLILRARGSARRLIDGAVLAGTKPLNNRASGHEDVLEVAPPEDPRWRYVGP